jgi:hypothetical protein
LIINQVWFSSPERSRTVWKLAAMDDTGALELTPGHIRYKGTKIGGFDIALTDIVVIRKGIQQFPWGVLVLGIPLVLLSIWSLASGLVDETVGALLNTALALAGVYVLNLMWRWVVVTWRDPLVGRQRTAYFRDGSARGLGGRTSEIFDLLDRHQCGQLRFEPAKEDGDGATRA